MVDSLLNIFVLYMNTFVGQNKQILNLMLIEGLIIVLTISFL